MVDVQKGLSYKRHKDELETGASSDWSKPEFELYIKWVQNKASFLFSCAIYAPICSSQGLEVTEPRDFRVK